MRIHKKESVAILVDMQERLFPHIHEHAQLEQNMLRLIRGLNLLDMPVLVTEQYAKGLGPTIPSVQAAVTHYEPMKKMSFSCCGAQSVMSALSEAHAKTVLVFGIEAHACVLQTAVDLLANGYTPVVVEDCISSRKLNDKQIAVARMRQEGAIITTYESILLELCVEAGTDTFKAISKTIK